MIDGDEGTCSQGPDGGSSLVWPLSVRSNNVEVTITVKNICGSFDDIDMVALVHLYPPLTLVRLCLWTELYLSLY